MSRQNTGNPVPSADPRDRYDNSIVLDELLDADAGVSVPDRLARPRKPWAQIELEASGLPAVQAAEAAAISAVQAEQFAVRAELAEGNAAVNAVIYSSVALGLVATAVGDQFQVLSPDSLRYLRYRVDAGPAAVYVGSIASDVYVDSVADRVFPAADVLQRDAAGVNLSVDFFGVADGTPAGSVGSPPLTAEGGAFLVSSSYAVAQTGTASATPAILRHVPSAAVYTQSVRVSSVGLSDANSRRVGALVQRLSATAIVGLAFNRLTGEVLLIRVSGGSVAALSTIATDAVTGLTEWIISTTVVGAGAWDVVITDPETGIASTQVRVTSSELGTATNPYLPAAGAFATAANSRVRSVSVNTDYSDTTGRITALEAGSPVESAARFDREAYELAPVGGALLRDNRMLSDALLVDRFDVPYGTPFPADYTPTYRPSSLAPSDYYLKGTAQWAVLDGLAPTVIGTGTAAAGLNVSAVLTDLPVGWYKQQRGVEVRFKAYVPPSAQLAKVSAVLAYPDGPFPGEGPGAIFVEWNRNTLRIFNRNEGAGASASVMYYNEVFGSTDPGAREIEFIVRVYTAPTGDTRDLIVAEVDGKRAAAMFFRPTAADPKRSPLRDITAVGVSVDPLDRGSLGVRIRDLIVQPVPQAGSSAYRTTEPLPAPVVPALTKVGVVLDANDLGLAGAPYVLGPSIIPMLDYADALGITPIDNYYMYVSTDHTAEEGGIWLCTGPTPTGPWTLYAGSAGEGRIYVDTVNGRQTEQPQVQYDPEQTRLIMIYHNAQGGANPWPTNAQYSVAATSGDGVSWARQGVCQPIPTALRSAYVGHDGYSSFGRDPLGIVPGWVGWFRISGGAGAIGGQASLWSHSRSPDGLLWESDLLPISIPSIDRPDYLQNVISNMGYGAVPFAYRGQRLFPIAPFRSVAVGSGASQGYLALVTMGDDMRSLSADEYVVEKTLPTESGVLTVSSVFVRGSTLYLYYTAQRQYVHLITADLAEPPAGVIRTL